MEKLLRWQLLSTMGLLIVAGVVFVAHAPQCTDHRGLILGNILMAGCR